MKAEDIRKTSITEMNDGSALGVDVALFLREIAAQLAELNEYLRYRDSDEKKSRRYAEASRQ